MQNSYLDYKNKIFLGRSNTSIWMLAKYLKTRIKKPVIIFPETMCVSPVNIFLLENYKILFVDVDKSTGLMDLNKLGKIKNKKEKILFYVNLYGNHDKIGRILKIKNQFKFIIQDLAQTLFFSDKLKNSKYMFGDFLVTSFAELFAGHYKKNDINNMFGGQIPEYTIDKFAKFANSSGNPKEKEPTKFAKFAKFVIQQI